MHQPTTLQEVYNLAINATIAYVDEQLLQQAFLLSDVHDLYFSTLKSNNDVENEREVTTIVAR